MHLKLARKFIQSKYLSSASHLLYLRYVGKKASILFFLENLQIM